MTETASQQQRMLARLCIQAGQLLLQHGAESSLVADLTRRLGLALGIDEISVSLSPNTITLTTIINNHCITTMRECPDRGIHMGVVTEVQHLVVMAEHKVLDSRSVASRLIKLDGKRYNRWLVLVMVGLSCASFSQLAGGDAAVFMMTLLATCCGMLVRQELGHRHFNPLLNFGVTAFVTTMAASPSFYFNIGNNPVLVMASAVLMLVPGFPLINAVSEMIKGHISMGWARWVFASLLVLATCIGMVSAINLMQLWPWLA